VCCNRKTIVSTASNVNKLAYYIGEQKQTFTAQASTLLRQQELWTKMRTYKPPYKPKERRQKQIYTHSLEERREEEMNLCLVSKRGSRQARTEKAARKETKNRE
jgi:hypothetical protein